MHSVLMIVLLLGEISVLLLLIFNFVSGFVSAIHGVPYVPIERHLIPNLLDFGNLKPEDIFCDLGSGDGRVLISAVKNYHVSEAKGYEVAPWPYFKSLLAVRRNHLKNIHVCYG